MKKILLFLSMCVFSTLVFAQTSLNEIPYSDGNTYSFSETFTPESGVGVFLPNGDFGEGANYWDLSDYRGLEFTFVCEEADIDSIMPLRLVMVGTDGTTAVSVYKDVAFTDTLATVKFEFSEEDFAGSTKLWGVKLTGWGGEFYLNNDVKIVSINALPKLKYTSLNDIAYSDGTTYSFSETFTPESGVGVFLPYGDFGEGANYWNLEDFLGIEFKFVCAEADIDSIMPLRLVMVGTDGTTAVSVYKDVIFTDTLATAYFEFSDEEFDGSTKLWGVKLTGWGGEFYLANDVKIVSINAFEEDNGNNSAIKDIKYNEIQNQDPNRLVSVYNISGQLIRKKVKFSEATNELRRGIYIIDRQKVFVNGN